MFKKTPTKIFFIGTPDFAVPALEALINDDNFIITGILTQPDKKSGRGQRINPPPIKKVASENGIIVYQPEKIKNMELPLEKPDMVMVIAYAQMIPNEWLNWSKLGALNLHASLLPLYRGASCIQASILNGDKKTGLSLIKITDKLDSGDILAKTEITISNNDNYGTLYTKLAELSPSFLIENLKEYTSNKLSGKKQNEKLSSYAPKIKKEDARLDWNKNAEILIREIKAYTPWPSSFFIWNDIKIKISKANYFSTKSGKTGEVIKIEDNILIKCQEGSIKLQKIKPENKSEMDIGDFINGKKDFIGSVL